MIVRCDFGDNITFFDPNKVSVQLSIDDIKFGAPLFVILAKDNQTDGQPAHPLHWFWLIKAQKMND